MSCASFQHSMFSGFPLIVLGSVKAIRSVILTLTHDLSQFCVQKCDGSTPDAALVAASISHVCSLCRFYDSTLPEVANSKLNINSKRYPAELVSGSVIKYMQYMQVTGYGKQQRDTIETLIEGTHMNCNMDNILQVVIQLTAFVNECNWEKFDMPMNLLLALIGELGELAALLSFCSGLIEARTKDNTICAKVLHEIADVAIYLLCLCII